MVNVFKEINFPYPTVRRGQDKFVIEVLKAIKENRNLMVSAPTGLGKTVSALAPAIYNAKKKGLGVICLTSRQTQANQIIKTIKDINSKSKDEVNYVAFIGKRSMCVHSNKDLYGPKDFNDFCKKVREEGKCKFFKNVKNVDLEDQVSTILKESSDVFMNVEGFVRLSGSNNFCPYEMAKLKAFKADVVICDFNYLFSSSIRENFLAQIGRTLEDCILVVDEAHNLPDRVRNSYSHSLSTEGLKNAIKELNSFIKEDKYDAHLFNLKTALEDIFFDKVLGDKYEYLIGKKEFLDSYLGRFNKLKFNLKTIIDDLKDVERLVKEERVVSYVGRVATFLEAWEKLDEESYVRILEKVVKNGKPELYLRINCLDPSSVSSEVLNNTHSSILMSGTLSPIKMYEDILGVGNCATLELDSPFNKEKQLTLVVDDVTSKYSSRSSDMFSKIAQNITEVLNAGYGKNAIIFFPSYDFLDKVVSLIKVSSLDRKVLKEQKFMNKEQKEEIVEIFKKGDGSFNDKPKVLFGITSGSFSEGLDLPKKALELVVIVGIPLGIPNIYTQGLISHYEKKFKKGQLYGYIQPAMSKIIQAAGRCIRTIDDTGVVVLMDTRFIFPMYAQNFPAHWKLRVPQDFKLEISNFFDESSND